MEAFPIYKRKTQVFHFPRASLLPYNSQTLSCTAEIDISLKSSRNGGWHRLDCYPIRSSFHRLKRGKRDIWSFLCSVFHVFNGGKWNGLYSNLYHPPFLRAFQGCIDLRCRWKHFRDISEKPKCSIFHVLRCYLITHKHFLVRRRPIYHWKALETAGDIG